ncbi:MAG TPA: Sua5/YciO/YrdC/YwlC family protein [Thermoleophilia bacterium]|nr:Sua5/YciO/YrdC/YwlC family protein [Thermoleophilia bacterium]
MTRLIELARLDERGAAGRDELAEAVAVAGLVCFPTDTVYGVGGVAAPATAAALARAKGRPSDKPFQLVYPTLGALLSAVALSPAVAAAARRLLPGPFTLLVPYPAGTSFPSPGAVEWPTTGRRADDGGVADDRAGDAEATTVATLGVRVPAWPPAARALAGLPFPLLASSANPSGGADPAALEQVEPALRAACDLLLDGGPTSGVSSTVLDLSGLEAGRGYRILRAGAADAATIAAIFANQEGPAAP